MTPGDAASEAPTLRDYGRVLRGRSSVIVAVVALTLLAALARDLTTTPLYRASAEVLLSRDSPADRLTGTSDGDTRGDPERFIQTQLQVARTDALARRVLGALNLRDRKPADLAAAVKVSAPQGADVLEFAVQDPSGPLAVRLARSYATRFMQYQRRLDNAALDRAVASVDARLSALADELPTGTGVSPAVRAEGSGQAPLYEALVDKKLQLQSLAPLQAGKTLVLSATGEPTKVRPRPKRDLAVALGLGLLVGVLLAFVLESADRRVDSAREIANILGIPLLGQVRLPAVRLRQLRARVLRRPDTRPVDGAEALRASIEVALGEIAGPAPGAVVLATSATRDDGRSSVMAALGVALARSGKRVILVDLDPAGSLGARLGVPMGPGLLDVAAGAAKLNDALVRCHAETPRLKFLPLGTRSDLPESERASSRRRNPVTALRARADLVLLSAPPLASIDGVRRTAADVDAVLAVVSVDSARRRALTRLGSELARLGPPKLGCIATGRALQPLPVHDAGRVVPLAGSSASTASDGLAAALAVAVADEPTAENGRGVRRGDV